MTTRTEPGSEAKARSDEIAAVELVNGASSSPLVLVCEHAGRAIPDHLGDLGLDREALERHIAYDIGAADVTRRLAGQLDAPAVLQRYSRLVIDCNRPIEVPDSIPEISDGTAIPGNCSLNAAERARRVDQVFTPFHDAVSVLLDQPGRRAALAIHSFTPALKGVSRPWDIGLLYRQDQRTSKRLGSALLAEQPGLRLGYNQPYQIDDISDWFVPQHGEALGLAHSMIEIRNDHIADPAGVSHWADLLAKAITSTMEML